MTVHHAVSLEPGGWRGERHRMTRVPSSIIRPRQALRVLLDEGPDFL